MKRTNVNFLVDALALVALVFLAATGALIRYVLPAGSGNTRALWGLDRHGWGDVHVWIAVAFCVAMVVHLVLHWGWITCVVRWDTRGRSKGRAVLALIALIALLALAAAPFFGMVEAPGKNAYAVVEVFDDRLEVRGVGRQQSLSLPLR